MKSEDVNRNLKVKKTFYFTFTNQTNILVKR